MNVFQAESRLLKSKQVQPLWVSQPIFVLNIVDAAPPDTPSLYWPAEMGVHPFFDKLTIETSLQ